MEDHAMNMPKIELSVNKNLSREVLSDDNIDHYSKLPFV